MANTSGGSVKKAQSEQRFKVPHSGTDGRAAHILDFRGLREASELRYGFENFKRSQPIHVPLLGTEMRRTGNEDLSPRLNVPPHPSSGAEMLLEKAGRSAVSKASRLSIVFFTTMSRECVGAMGICKDLDKWLVFHGVFYRRLGIL
jgi:hypothetical protein